MRFVPGLMHALHILWIEPMVYSRLTTVRYRFLLFKAWADCFLALRFEVFGVRGLSDRLEQIFFDILRLASWHC
jgi:hypothetical protein